MNLLELALESTEKHGWCRGELFDDQTRRSCVEGHILRAHGHGAEAAYQDYELLKKCAECHKALLALHAAGAVNSEPRVGATPIEHVYGWNDDLSMPRDEALYRDTLLRGAKLLDEVQA